MDNDGEIGDGQWAASGMIPKDRQRHVPHWRHNRAVRDLFPSHSSKVRVTYTRDSYFHTIQEAHPTQPKPTYEITVAHTTVNL